MALHCLCDLLILYGLEKWVLISVSDSEINSGYSVIYYYLETEQKKLSFLILLKELNPVRLPDQIT